MPDAHPDAGLVKAAPPSRPGILAWFRDRRALSAPQTSRQALRRGRSAILWENAVVGSAEVRYFVQGLRERRHDSADFRALPDAERCFDRLTGSDQSY